MKYRFEDISGADLVLIGEALDAMAHGRVQDLVRRMQAQISGQEAAEAERAAAESKAANESWQDAERSKIKDELTRKKRG